VNLLRTFLSAKFICCCWRNPWCDFLVTHTRKCNEPAKTRAIVVAEQDGLSLCFRFAAYEIRHSLDLALLANQNGRYLYKTHLATLLVTVHIFSFHVWPFAFMLQVTWVKQLFISFVVGVLTTSFARALHELIH